MNLFLVKGIWHVRFQISGERRSRTTRERTRRKALVVAETIYRRALAESRGERPTPTLSEAVQEWLRLHQRRKSANYLRQVDLFGRSYLYSLGEVPLHRIRTIEVEDALAAHLATRSLASGNAWLRNLRMIFHWSVRRKTLRAVPWEVAPARLQKRRRSTLPIGKVVAWLDALDTATQDPHVRLACRLMLFLGLRESEALGARWENLDFDSETYTPHWTKGKEAYPLPACLVVDYLRPLAQVEGLMMPGKEGRPHAHNFCGDAILAANKAAGTPKISNHRLRGTFATLLHVVAGCDVETVRRAMRHKDPRTTLGYLESMEDLEVSAGMDRLKAKLGMSGEKVAKEATPTSTEPHSHVYQ